MRDEVLNPWIDQNNGNESIQKQCDDETVGNDNPSNIKGSWKEVGLNRIYQAKDGRANGKEGEVVDTVEGPLNEERKKKKVPEGELGRTLTI